MRLKHLLTAVLLVPMMTACGPRTPVVVAPPPAPPPPPPPPAPEAAPAELAALNASRAREAWERGTVSGRAGRWQEAERLYREAVRAQPTSPTYHLALANALLQQGRESEGADALLAGVRAEEAMPRPNHRVLAVDYERLIQLLERVGRLDEARTARERQRFHRTMRDAAPPER